MKAEQDDKTPYCDLRRVHGARCRWRAFIPMLYLGLVSVASPCDALTTASVALPLNPNAAEDGPGAEGNESSVSVAGATGIFVSIYSSPDSLGGAVGSDKDVLAVRSTDGGRTWSAAIPVNSDADSDTVDNFTTALSTNGSGTWIAAWDSNGDGFSTSRSTDNGISWATASSIATRGFHPDASSAGAVHIVVWWASSVPGFGSDGDVFFSRTTDDGVTWSPAAALDTEADSDLEYDAYPRIATDGGGNWVSAWLSYDRIVASRSVDNGATWSEAIDIGPANDFGNRPVDVATDEAGHWIIVWDSYARTISGLSGPDFDLAYSRSTDAGATWSTPQALLSDAMEDAASEGAPRIERSADGELQVVWHQALDSFGGTVGKEDGDIFGARSLDGGLTWSPRALINSNGSRDSSAADDSNVCIATDEAGGTVIAWYSKDSLGGTIGDDGDILSMASHDDCPVAPRNDCVGATSGGGSRLTIKNGNGGSDRFLWKWSGVDTLAVDLGDPTASSGGYALCMYDKVGMDLRAVFELDALGAATCSTAGTPCWSETKSGYRYKDGTNRNGAVKAASLSAVSGERGKFKVLGAGPTLSLPALPLAVNPQVEVQLLNKENGLCWTATYSATQANDATRLKARSD